MRSRGQGRYKRNEQKENPDLTDGRKPGLMAVEKKKKKSTEVKERRKINPRRSPKKAEVKACRCSVCRARRRLL